MAKKDFLLRHFLIIRKLKTYGSLTFQEIIDHLEKEAELRDCDLTLSIRTFQRDIKEIRELYEIDIQYDFSRKVYFIDEEEAGSEQNIRLLESFELFNTLNISDNLGDYIQFEKRRPLGIQHIFGLLHAIKNSNIVRFKHVKYWEDIVTDRVVEPLALRECQQRWYLVGHDLNDHQNMIKAFGLDRITDLDITKKRFNLPVRFDQNAYFKHSFGVINPIGDKPEKIILSFEYEQGRYVKSLPLHASQKILIDTSKELRISLELYLTYDLIMEIMKYGPAVKVIQPVSLKNEIIQYLQNTLDKYQVIRK